MYRVALDLQQDDCPLTAASADHEVTISTPHWRFDSEADRWHLRIRVCADPGSGELERALRTLRDDRRMQEFRLYAKRDGTAVARTVFAETTAIDVVTRHGGYVVGPFYNTDGRERWRLGFDDDARAETALSELDRYEPFSVHDEWTLDPITETRRSDASGGVAIQAAKHPDESLGHRQWTMAEMLEGATTLTDTEQRVLHTAYEQGYFETPREVTLEELGDTLDVSDVAVSQTLRRVQRKLVDATVTALQDSHTST
jgi:predicted DNA binding protein